MLSYLATVAGNEQIIHTFDLQLVRQTTLAQMDRPDLDFRQ